MSVTIASTDNHFYICQVCFQLIDSPSQSSLYFLFNGIINTTRVVGCTKEESQKKHWNQRKYRFKVSS